MIRSVNNPHPAKVDGQSRAPLCWLLPPRCIVCGDPGSAGRDLCATCQAQLPWQPRGCPRCGLPSPTGTLCAHCCLQPPPLDAVHAAFDYRFPIDCLLPRLKFHRDFAAGRVLSHCLVDHFATLERPLALVPIPLHRSRLRTRGYDQALELAKPLARALKLPLRTDLLQRGRATHAQSELHANARQRNVQGAFRLINDSPLPSHIALFDDVMTTGATLHAAALVLRHAGVQRIEAWVCARVPLPPSSPSSS